MLDARERLQAPIDTIQIGVTGGATISPDILRKIREQLRVDRMQVKRETICFFYKKRKSNFFRTGRVTVYYTLSIELITSMLDEVINGVRTDKVGRHTESEAALSNDEEVVDSVSH